MDENFWPTVGACGPHGGPKFFLIFVFQLLILHMLSASTVKFSQR